MAVGEEKGGLDEACSEGFGTDAGTKGRRDGGVVCLVVDADMGLGHEKVDYPVHDLGRQVTDLGHLGDRSRGTANAGRSQSERGLAGIREGKEGCGVQGEPGPRAAALGCASRHLSRPISQVPQAVLPVILPNQNLVSLTVCHLNSAASKSQ